MNPIDDLIKHVENYVEYLKYLISRNKIYNNDPNEKIDCKKYPERYGKLFICQEILKKARKLKAKNEKPPHDD